MLLPWGFRLAHAAYANNHHELVSSESAVKLSSDRVFGVVFAIFFGVISVLPMLRREGPRWGSVGISLVCVALALAAPRVPHPFNIVWGRLAVLLHRLISPVAMALLFYLGFGITGFVVRLSGKDLLRLKIDPERETYWIPRDHPGPTPDSMLRQF